MNNLFVNRQAFVPHLRAKSVAHINYSELRNAGIEYIMFDKDNTLTEPYVRDYFNTTLELAIKTDCQAAFGNENMAVLSNSVGSKDDPGHAEAIIVEGTLGMAVIRHERKKPAVRDDVLDHFKTQDIEKVAIVGDRILSDIVMGNNHGMFTIYVEPLNV